jgi:hypothetical protein
VRPTISRKLAANVINVAVLVSSIVVFVLFAWAGGA